MNAKFIQETKVSPRVEFYPNGDLLIQGRSLPYDPKKFYDPLLRWAEECTCEQINFTIRLEYINTSSSNQLFQLLKTLKECLSVKQFHVDWYYEEGDEDNYVAGHEFESLFDMSFNFHEYAEVLE